MTYQEHISVIKKIPITDAYMIKQAILKIRDHSMVCKICAKWYTLHLSNVKYKKKPPEPMSYTEMQRLKLNGHNIAHHMELDDVKQYIKDKNRIEFENYAEFQWLKEAHNDLDISEIKAKSDIEDKIKEFLVNAKNDTIGRIYDFTNDPIRSRVYKQKAEMGVYN